MRVKRSAVGDDVGDAEQHDGFADDAAAAVGNDVRHNCLLHHPKLPLVLHAFLVVIQAHLRSKHAVVGVAVAVHLQPVHSNKHSKK